MIIIITGATHTGKTVLAQRLLEKYRYPYLSIDHLKMGLIRSGRTSLTPASSSEQLTAYLWPIVREMIKTAIENRQNLIVEGCYIPFDWAEHFNSEYRESIKFICLVMSADYINKNFAAVKANASAVEDRGDDEGYTPDDLIAENLRYLNGCKKYGLDCIYISENYSINVEAP